jgi:acyl carrier protein
MNIDHNRAANLTMFGSGLYPTRAKNGLDGGQMSIRLTVMSQIEQIAAEQRVTLPPLDDELVLLNSGLDSLCFAILVTRLEDSLGIDPFTASDEVYFPVTLGDFVKVYEDAAR